MKSRVIQDEPDDDRPPRTRPAESASPVPAWRARWVARALAWFRRRP